MVNFLANGDNVKVTATIASIVIAMCETSFRSLLVDVAAESIILAAAFVVEGIGYDDGNLFTVIALTGTIVAAIFGFQIVSGKVV